MKNDLDGIISISFGEIAFLLLFIFMTFFYYEYSNIEQLEGELEKTQGELASKEKQLNEINSKLAELKNRSRQKPTCKQLSSDLGISELISDYINNNFLFHCVIIGRDQYLIMEEKKVYDYNELKRKLSKNISLAEKHSCAHTATYQYVSYTPYLSNLLSVSDLSVSVKNLEKDFYLSNRGEIKDIYILATGNNRFTVKSDNPGSQSLTLKEIENKFKTTPDLVVQFQYMNSVSNKNEIISKLNKIFIYTIDRGLYGVQGN